MLQRSEELPLDLRIFAFRGIFARNNNDVKTTAEEIPVKPENFTDAPLQFISLCRRFVDFGGDREAEPAGAALGLQDDDEEMFRIELLTASLRLLEVRLLLDAMVGRERNL